MSVSTRSPSVRISYSTPDSISIMPSSEPSARVWAFKEPFLSWDPKPRTTPLFVQMMWPFFIASFSKVLCFKTLAETTSLIFPLPFFALSDCEYSDLTTSPFFSTVWELCTKLMLSASAVATERLALVMAERMLLPSSSILLKLSVLPLTGSVTFDSSPSVGLPTNFSVVSVVPSGLVLVSVTFMELSGAVSVTDSCEVPSAKVSRTSFLTVPSALVSMVVTVVVWIPLSSVTTVSTLSWSQSWSGYHRHRSRQRSRYSSPHCHRCPWSFRWWSRS